MFSVHGFLKEMAGQILSAEEPRRKYELHGVKISFSAPPLSKPSETLTKEEKKQTEANFQWLKYAILFSDVERKDWYAYITPLYPWGKKQEGGQEVIVSNPDWAEDRTKPVDLSPKEVEKFFPDVLKGPDLQPTLPESMVEYIQEYKKRIAGKFSATEFKMKFEKAKNPDGSSFYILITKDNNIYTPWGNPVGKEKL